jgi:hypothetical protein
VKQLKRLNDIPHLCRVRGHGENQTDGREIIVTAH